MFTGPLLAKVVNDYKLTVACTLFVFHYLFGIPMEEWLLLLGCVLVGVEACLRFIRLVREQLPESMTAAVANVIIDLVVAGIILCNRDQEGFSPTGYIAVGCFGVLLLDDVMLLIKLKLKTAESVSEE